MSPRRKHILLLVGLAALAAGLALLVMVKARPAAYSRAGEAIADPAVRREALRQFDEAVVNRVADVLFDQSGRTALNVTVTEEMINARLRLYLDEAARNGERVLPEIATLRVAFEPGCVVLGTRIGRGAASVVATQEVRLAATADGLLDVKMGELHAGWLPVPRSVADPLRASLKKTAARSETAGDEDGADELWRALVAGMDGGPVPVGQGKKQIVLEKLQVERGSLHVEGHKANAKRDAPR